MYSFSPAETLYLAPVVKEMMHNDTEIGRSTRVGCMNRQCTFSDEIVENFSLYILIYVLCV